jgi:putative peptidoglycan lipid II flippase
MSIATTFIPEMARAVARQDRVAFIERTGLGIRLVGLLTFPAAFGFLVMSRPIIGALLRYGQFSNEAADTTARALSGLALGLVGYSVYLFTLRGFFAHQDTKTPFIINCVQNAINIVLAFPLARQFDVLGLGIAFSISYFIGALVALFVLRTKEEDFPVLPILTALGRMLLASAIMGVVVWLSIAAVGSDDGFGAIFKVAVGFIVGMVVYVGALTLLRAPEVHGLRQLWSRLSRTSAP